MTDTTSVRLATKYFGEAGEGGVKRTNYVDQHAASSFFFLNGVYVSLWQ